MKTRELSVAFASVLKRLDLLDAKMSEVPQIHVQVSHRLLPTLTALTNLGSGTASQISKITGRARAFESKNLNELNLMGVLTKHSQGREQIFKSKHPVLQIAFQRFFTVLSSMCDGIIIVSNDNIIEFVNQAFCDYFDLDVLPGELKGLKLDEITEEVNASFLHPDEQKIRVREIIAEGKIKKGEEIAMKDGRTCMREVVPLTVDEKPFGWLYQYIDVTENMTANEALRKSEARYRSFIELTHEVGWTTNRDGEVVEDIQSWRKYTGQSFKEMEGWGWSKVIHPDDVEFAIKTLKDAVKTKTSYEVEYRMRRFDGVYRNFLARAAPVVNDDGSILEWVGTCIDITERKQMQQKIEAFASHIEELVQERAKLLKHEENFLKSNSSPQQIQSLA
jgi:PAS domain S-box-containing protein